MSAMCGKAFLSDALPLTLRRCTEGKHRWGGRAGSLPDPAHMWVTCSHAPCKSRPWRRLSSMETTLILGWCSGRSQGMHRLAGSAPNRTRGRVVQH